MREHLTPGAQPPHARALRAADRRARAARARARLRASPSTQLHENLLTDFGADGVHRERSTHYHMIALRSFVGARENCRRFGVALPAELRRAAAPRLRVRPRLPPPRRHDPGALGQRHRRLHRAARRSPRGCSRATTCSTRRPSELRRRRLLRPARGRPLPDLRLRPARRRRPRPLRRAQRRGVGGRPRRWCMDPGRFTYAEGEPNLRHWFRGTAAHNTVTVDGADQTPYARCALLAAERRGDVPRPRHARRPRHPRRRGPQPGLRGRPPPPRDLRRRRATGSIEDALTGERAPPLRPALAPRRRTAHVPTAPCTAAPSRGARAIALEDGWISPAYGVRDAAPVVSAVATGASARASSRCSRRATRASLELDGDIAARRRATRSCSASG